MKPIKATRSSTLLHSVEDLSTDSSCLFKARNISRGSSRRRGATNGSGTADVSTTETTAPMRNGSGFSTDEFVDKVPLNINHYSAKQASAYRGLSKSMILPTPASDLSDFDDTIKTEERKSCCDKIKRFAINFRTFEHGLCIILRISIYSFLISITNIQFDYQLYQL